MPRPWPSAADGARPLPGFPSACPCQAPPGAQCRGCHWPLSLSLVFNLEELRKCVIFFYYFLIFKLVHTLVNQLV